MNLYRDRISSTNLDLYRQLAGTGWQDAQLQQLRDVYEAVARFSFSSFRPNWKPFLCHLVGVASIVAWDSRDSVLVSAALAHSALEFGRFPLAVRVSAKRTERYLESALGSDVFTLVKAYRHADWKRLMAPGGIAAPSATDTALRHLKLADTVDDLTDELSPVATRKTLSVRRDNAQNMADCAALSRLIGAPNLAAAYESLAAAAPVNAVIQEPLGRTFSLQAGGGR